MQDNPCSGMAIPNRIPGSELHPHGYHNHDSSHYVPENKTLWYVNAMVMVAMWSSLAGGPTPVVSRATWLIPMNGRLVACHVVSSVIERGEVIDRS